jgi:hypothetical protein
MQASQQLKKVKNPACRQAGVRRASPRQRLIAALISLAVFGSLTLFALAGHYQIDTSRWLGYCGFKQRYGLPCPTCGMTTAVLAFAQGRIWQAFYIQPAAAFLCSFMVLAAVLCVIVAIFGIYFSFLDRVFTEVKIRHVIIALIVIVAAGWAVTLARALAANAHQAHNLDSASCATGCVARFDHEPY